MTEYYHYVSYVAGYAPSLVVGLVWSLAVCVLAYAESRQQSADVKNVKWEQTQRGWYTLGSCTIRMAPRNADEMYTIVSACRYLALKYEAVVDGEAGDAMMMAGNKCPVQPKVATRCTSACTVASMDPRVYIDMRNCCRIRAISHPGAFLSSADIDAVLWLVEPGALATNVSDLSAHGNWESTWNNPWDTVWNTSTDSDPHIWHTVWDVLGGGFGDDIHTLAPASRYMRLLSVLSSDCTTVTFCRTALSAAALSTYHQSTWTNALASYDAMGIPLCMILANGDPQVDKEKDACVSSLSADATKSSDVNTVKQQPNEYLLHLEMIRTAFGESIDTNNNNNNNDEDKVAVIQQVIEDEKKDEEDNDDDEEKQTAYILADTHTDHVNMSTKISAERRTVDTWINSLEQYVRMPETEDDMTYEAEEDEETAAAEDEEEEKKKTNDQASVFCMPQGYVLSGRSALRAVKKVIATGRQLASGGWQQRWWVRTSAVKQIAVFIQTQYTMTVSIADSAASLCTHPVVVLVQPSRATTRDPFIRMWVAGACQHSKSLSIALRGEMKQHPFAVRMDWRDVYLSARVFGEVETDDTAGVSSTDGALKIECDAMNAHLGRALLAVRWDVSSEYSTLNDPPIVCSTVGVCAHIREPRQYAYTY
jgi:hypothetical protein